MDGGVRASSPAVAQKNAGPRRSRAPTSMCCTRVHLFREAAHEDAVVRGVGSVRGPVERRFRNSMRHLLGSGTSPRTPSHGKVGVISNT